MTIQVPQLLAKAGVDGFGKIRVAQVASKSAVDSFGKVRVAQIVAKAAVRLYPINNIVRIPPPVSLPLVCSCNCVPCFNDNGAK